MNNKWFKAIISISIISFYPMFIIAQNLLPEWHRIHSVDETYSINRVVGTYSNDSLGIIIELTEDDGRLLATFRGEYIEGFLLFDEDKNATYKLKYRELADRLMKGWVNNNDWQIYDVIGGRWFEDTVSTDRYVRYFKQTYESLNNESDSIKSYRILGTFKRDQWDDHGYTNDNFSYSTFIEVKTFANKTKYMGIGWQNKRPDHAGGFRISDLNTKFTRKKMIFEPRSPSKFVAFDVISDIKVAINFLPKGVQKNEYKNIKIDYLRIGETKFKKENSNK